MISRYRGVAMRRKGSRRWGESYTAKIPANRARVIDNALRLVPEPRRQLLREAVDRITPGRYPVATEPPPLRPGRVTGPPDFIGVGVQKAGTTWWYGLLMGQPAIHLERGLRKERHFFNRFYASTPTEEDAETYSRWFPRIPGKLTGEWSVSYMHHFWVPPLIAVIAPDAKLLVMLRDPITRYQSGLTFENNFIPGSLPRYQNADDAFAMGLYGAQLARLRAAVDPSKILVLQFERCVMDPSNELRRTLDFLGIDDPPQMSEPRTNATIGPKIALPEHVREGLVVRYAPDVRQLLTICPEIDLDLWPAWLEAHRSYMGD
jgi:Sulfotransferase family